MPRDAPTTRATGFDEGDMFICPVQRNAGMSNMLILFQHEIGRFLADCIFCTEYEWCSLTEDPN